MDCEKLSVNTITEIYKGIYSVLLDFPTKDILYSMINKSYKYVWCVNYTANSYVWRDNVNNLYDVEVHDVLTRNIKMEYLMKTEDFIRIIPSIRGSLHLLQTNTIPPYYLDIQGFTGDLKYKLLSNNIDFLFEIDLPASPDYTEVISPNKFFLEDLINKNNI